MEIFGLSCTRVNRAFKGRVLSEDSQCRKPHRKADLGEPRHNFA